MGKLNKQRKMPLFTSLLFTYETKYGENVPSLAVSFVMVSK